MSDTRYMISEAAKITQVESHVLRYWEEELKLPIGRNEMGHRYYTEKDIQTFRNIKELKKKGMQLRAIREMVHQEDEKKEEPPRVIVRQPERFQSPEGGQAVKAPVEEAKKTETEKVPADEKPVQSNGGNRRTEKIVAGKTKEERFGEIMERLIREIARSERKEGRYRRLDEAIRRHQQSRKMVAATEENKNRKKKSR
ncbi:MAG: MerR family transcriptional regulator [Clostridiales bacterium]|nr:MerR family transcriptional regulator [Clostridiales bacterium]